MTRLLAAVFAVAVLSLTACGPTGSPAPTESASESASAEPSESPSPDPEPEPEPEAVTCENLVDPETLAGWTADGLTITPVADFEAKLRSEGNTFVGFFDAGGVVCQVGGGYEAYELYAWAPFVEAYSIPIQVGLTAEGFTPSASGGVTLYSLPADYDNIVYRCSFSDTVIACAIDDARLAEVLTNAPID